MKNIKNQLIFLVFLLSVLNYSCKKFLDVPAPKDSATPSEMFTSDAIATSAVTGIYSKMAASGAFCGNQNSITVVGGLSADEFKSNNASLDVYYNNEIPASDFGMQFYIWSPIYNYIYTANAIIEGLKSATGVSESTSRQLQGEAKFIRAFCYFYLVNLYGDVPLALTTDYRVNAMIQRSSKENVYTQIVQDLIDSENLLTSNYITTERIRPNKWTAAALLSRVYLYTERWDLAIQKATEVIDQKNTYSLTDLDRVFLKNSLETIWQLMPTAGGNTLEGTTFILNSTPTNVSLAPTLVNAFDLGDNRKIKWTSQYTNSTGTYYYPFKYKVKSSATITEYSTIIRLAELYLIRSEAEAKLQQTGAALVDINIIRTRAGLTVPLLNLNQAQCLVEIEKQRRFELFSEFGHRWLDLKRNGRASTILAPLKGFTWTNSDMLYPIPDIEVTRNPNIAQNPGY